MRFCLRHQWTADGRSTGTTDRPEGRLTDIPLAMHQLPDQKYAGANSGRAHRTKLNNIYDPPRSVLTSYRKWNVVDAWDQLAEKPVAWMAPQAIFLATSWFLSDHDGSSEETLT